MKSQNVPQASVRPGSRFPGFGTGAEVALGGVGHAGLGARAGGVGGGARLRRGGNAFVQEQLALQAIERPPASAELLSLLPGLGALAGVVLDALPQEHARSLAGLLPDAPEVVGWLESHSGGRGGAALPAELSRRAEGSLGVALGDVRIHRDGGSAKIAEDLGYQAFTDGEHIHLGAGVGCGHEGQAVLMHEIAHIAAAAGQGASPVAEGAAEAKADEAAGAMLSGKKAEAGQAAPGLRGFGAGSHEAITVEGAEAAGMSADQAQEIYRGNWQRDMSAAVLPMSDSLGLSTPVLVMLDLLSRKKFGVGIEEAALETYDPVEHIDNPTGQTGSDAWDQGGIDTATQHQTAASAAGRLPDAPYTRCDDRYREACPDPGDRAFKHRGGDPAAFVVDESGLPAYMIASRDLMHTQVAEAVAAGGEAGAVRAGDATHILQDFYAHSNFCEIATNLLLSEGKVLVGEAGEHQIDTGVHRITQDGTVKSDENLRTRDGREVMATTSFTGEDTVYSVQKLAFELLEEFDPFEEGASVGDTLLPVLSWVEANPAYMGGLGDAMATVADSLGTIFVPVLDQALAAAGGAHSGLGAVETGLIAAGGGLADMVLGAVAGVAGAVGAEGVAGAVNETAADVGTAGAAAATASRADTAVMVTACADARMELAEVQASLAAGEGGLATLAEIALHGFEPALKLQNLVAPLPVVGAALSAEVAAAEDALRELARAKLDAWWAELREVLEEEVAAMTAAELGETAVGTHDDRAYTGSRTMTAPSHTDLAKDFEEEGGHSPGDHEGDAYEDPVHSGAVFSALAMAMAQDATGAVLGRLQDCWTGTGEIEMLDAEIDRWFDHPESNRDTWEARFVATIESDAALAAAIVERSETPIAYQ